MNKLILALTALFFGVLGVFAFSPFDYWPLAYVSLFALLWLIKTFPKKQALCLAFLWGMGFFGVGVSWLHISIFQFGGASWAVSYLLVALLAAYLSLFPLLFAYIIQRFKVQSAVIFAIVWTFVEFLRGWLFTGFPWLQFGYSQIDSPFAGIAPIFGVTGLTFFILWATATIFNLYSALFKAEKKGLLVTSNALLLIVVGTLSYLTNKIEFVKPEPERALTITLAQGNIQQNLKWNPDYFYSTLAIYQNLIEQSLAKADLIILPESALPMLENAIEPFFSNLDQIGKNTNTEIMIGTIFRDETSNKLFNSIVVVGNSQFPYQLNTSNRYSKHHLVPFGEYVPLENLLRPLGSIFNLPMSGFESGKAIQSPLMVKGRNFSAAICYEIILGSQVQQNLTQDTDYLVTVSNDAWFGDSIGPYQHLQMARMRALELGKPLIRATNTGISVFVNQQGKIEAQAQPFVQTSLTDKIVPTTGQTPYAVLGNMPLYLLSLLILVMHGVAILLKNKISNLTPKD